MRIIGPTFEDSPACVALKTRPLRSGMIDKKTYRKTFALSQLRDQNVLIAELVEVGSSYKSFIEKDLWWALVAILWNPLFVDGILDVTNYPIHKDVIEQLIRFCPVPHNVLLSLAVRGTWYTKIQIGRRQVPLDVQVALCSGADEVEIFRAINDNPTFDEDIKVMANLKLMVCQAEEEYA